MKKNCEICKHIKDIQISNIGGNEYFQDEVEKALGKLEVLGEKWYYGTFKVLRCPLCRSIYFYDEESSFTGSGISDNQYLYRARFKADDQIDRQGRGYYAEIAVILSECEKKDDTEIKEIINKIAKIKYV